MFVICFTSSYTEILFTLTMFNKHRSKNLTLNKTGTLLQKSLIRFLKKNVEENSQCFISKITKEKQMRSLMYDITSRALFPHHVQKNDEVAKK